MRGLLAAALLVGCATPPTQLVVVVDSNLDVPLELDLVEVAVQGPDGVTTTTPQALGGADAPAFPLTLGVTPGGEALGPVTVTAIGRLGDAEVVRQSATTTLVLGETRTLHLVLYRSCVGRQCGSGRTCDAAGCVPLERGDLPAWTGTPPPVDDSDPCLAMPWDVDGDGEGSDTCGGTDCDDAEPRAFSMATEDCNGIDDDCDAQTDEGCDCTPLDAVEDCTTTCGTTGRRTCTASGWAPCVLPAEACNAVDDDCDGVTDEGFDYAAGAPVAVTDTSRPSLDPDLIWAGDRFALAWHDDIADQGVYFTTLDGAGASEVAPRQVSEDGRMPAIAWDGSGYGLVYWDRDTVSCGVDCTQLLDRVYFAPLGADGAPLLAEPERVDSDAANEPRPVIVHDGTSYVIGWRGDDLFLEARGVDGARVGARVTVPASREEQFDLVYTGSRLALAYAGGNQGYFTQGDLAAFPAMDVLVGPFERSASAALVFTGDGFVVTYQSGLGVLRSSAVHAVALDVDGAARGAPAMLSAMRRDADVFGDPDPSGMAAAPGQVLVTWVEDGSPPSVRFVRLAPDGATLQGPTAVVGLGGVPQQTTVAWSTDGAFGLVFVEDPSRGSEQLVYVPVRCAAP